MFTGLIEAVVPVLALKRQGGGAVLEVELPASFDDVRKGDSISVSGVCLTVLGPVGGTSLRFDVSAESLSRSTISDLRSTSRVNLERALMAGARLGGHIVAGHVDATARVLGIERSGEFWTVWVELQPSFERYVVEKGSIALDGVSLTVARLEPDRFSVAVIPETYRATNMPGWQPGTLVNVEVDIVGKYVERLLGAYRTEIPAAPSTSSDDRLRDLLGG
ncbi:MAG: riboflavin synthase [Thermoanaerobaculia bacterium]|nr:riboflavin synthase [Thermoanaerobaculia bacterium]